MIDLSWLIINEEESRMRREAEEDGYEYEPMLSVGDLIDFLDVSKWWRKDDSTDSK